MTRYFGGTKLGAGGLVRAQYSGAVIEGLTAIGIVECGLEDQSLSLPLIMHIRKGEYYCQTPKYSHRRSESPNNVSIHL